MKSSADNADQQPFTVSEFTRLSKMLVEEAFSSVQIEGEVSNFVQSSVGHWYFSLKDDKSQIRCALFRSYQQNLNLIPENGLQVRLEACASIYEPRGEYQLIVRQVDAVGIGALQRQFEQLKKRLYQEGLFDEAHKKPLPEFPRQIGVITSPTGAAVRDVINVTRRRYPAASLIIYPTLVQGTDAPPNIVKMIQKANQQDECDVLILCRGGGSIEDLWAFNEEIVARAVFESHIPIIAGIGHEIDYTIADFVADRRAPTPSAAAELAVPDSGKLIAALRDQQAHLKSLLQKRIHQITELFSHLQRRLLFCDPRKQLERQHEQLIRLRKNLEKAQRQFFDVKTYQLAQLTDMLNALNPLAVLKRGYAVLQDAEGHFIRDAHMVKIQDKITARLYQGELRCTVDEVIKPKE